MQRVLASAVSVLAVALIALPAVADDKEAAESAWTHDLAKAKEMAKKSGKFIVADFTGSDW